MRLTKLLNLDSRMASLVTQPDRKTKPHIDKLAEIRTTIVKGELECSRTTERASCEP